MPGAFKSLPKNRRGALPIVIVLTVQEKDTDRLGIRRLRSERRKRNGYECHQWQESETAKKVHGLGTGSWMFTVEILGDGRLSSGAGSGEFKKQIFDVCYSKIAQLVF
jgi:hypothetical protein